MADVQWIKIATGIFDNRKIKQIESLPDADAVIVIWFKILCLAGNLNESGQLIITKDVPYTEEMLSNEFRKPINTIRMALGVFEKYGMIEIFDDIMRVSNWEKYQSEDKLREIREKNRRRVAQHRAKKRNDALPEPKENSNVTVTLPLHYGNAIEEDKEKEKDLDKRKENIDYQRIVGLYNETCVSFPRLKTLSETRKKSIKARFHSGYNYSDFEELFKKAEESSFLKGGNDRDWSATFDWMIKDGNMAKVLEGNYDNKQKVITTANTGQRSNNRALQMLKDMGEI